MEKDHRLLGLVRTKFLWATLLFLVAIFLRLAYQQSAIVNNPIRADAREYYYTAYNLYHHGVYSIERGADDNAAPRPTWRRTPGYPLFLYPFFLFSKTPHEFIINVSLAQAVLGALTCILIYILGVSLISPFWAFVAGLMTAASPHLIAMDDFLLAESLFTFIMVLATLTMVVALKKNSWNLSLLSGAIFCFSSLVRAISGLLGPLLALVFLSRAIGAPNRKNAYFCVGPLLFIAGLALVYLPYAHFRQSIMAQAAYVTNESAWRHIVLGADVNLANFIPSKYVPEIKQETEKMINDKSYGWAKLRERVADDPWSFIRWYGGGKLLFMWQWDNFYIGDVYQYPMINKGFHQGNWLSWIHHTMRRLHWPALWLALAGTVVYFIKWLRNRLPDTHKLLLAPILIFLYFAIILTILTPLPRYAIPIRPFVYLIGCYPLMLLSQSVIGRFDKAAVRV